MIRKRIILLFFTIMLLFSSCFVKPNGGYVLFFNPRIKSEYCQNKETILGASEYLFRKVFGMRNYKDYYITSRECGDTLVLTYIKKELNNDRIMRFEVDKIDDEIIQELIDSNIDSTEISNVQVLVSREECNCNIITLYIPINIDDISSDRKIIFRSDNICKIVISKKECKIIDFICG